MEYTDKITLTDKAAAYLKELLSTMENGDEASLRLYVAGGGCSGLAIDLDTDVSDIVYEDESGLKIVVDDQSINYVHGSTIDYVETSDLTGAFKVDNPNVTSGGCGCGKSFSAEGAPSTGCGGCSNG